jgi:hypothetical protein
MTVAPIITGMQNATTALTKAIDAQQQELARALDMLAQDVQSNLERPSQLWQSRRSVVDSGSPPSLAAARNRE